MSDFKVSDEILAQLAKMDEQAKSGVASVPPPEFVAEFVKFQRGMRQWKQETLASFAGVSLTTIERIERGEVVSPESLDKTAVALGYEQGDFTEPRVPLSSKEGAEKLKESFARFEGLVPVQVRPFRTQLQETALARCHLYLVDGSHLGEPYEEDLDNIREWLDLTAFVIGKERGFSSQGDRPVRRRELYIEILKAVRDLEKRSHSVALCGIYSAKTKIAALSTAQVALVAFFPKLSDPGAVKRKVLLAPERVEPEFRG